MKSNRSTIVLLLLFFGGLLTLWGLKFAGVHTSLEEQRRADRILPDLIDAPPESIRKVAIDRGKEHLVFERGRGQNRWQMVEPLDVAAEPTRLETLVRNLKELRKSPDAGTITNPAATFGLDPPGATVRLYGQVDARSVRAGGNEPLAALEVGKSVRSLRYVRRSGETVIEVADGKLLGALDLPVFDWREPVLMGVPTFQVESLTITRRAATRDSASGKPQSAPRATPESDVTRVERDPSGRWKLTAPISALANGARIESLLAALASIRVADPPRGFVADNVKDATRFGLAAPEITVELTTTRPDDVPLILEVGKAVPEWPDRVYARQGGQDDVVIVVAKPLTEIPDDSTPLRSRQVTDIAPAAVTEILIQGPQGKFSLARGSSGWELLVPRREKADPTAVNTFLDRIARLQTSDFFAPSRVPKPEVDPPGTIIEVRQSATGHARGGPNETSSLPALRLRLGRHDVLNRTIYAQLETDRLILALPDNLLEVLPKNEYAFRDRTIVTESPANVRKLTIRRGDRTDVLEPSTTGDPNSWRMRVPVEAPADSATITQLLSVLSSLRAEDFAVDSIGDGKAFGLDRPPISVTWESDREHRIRIGAVVPRTSNRYAALDLQPIVFIVSAAVVRLFADAEFHDHHVWTFDAARAEHVVLRWPHRKVSLRRRPPLAKGQLEWIPDPGTGAEDVDLSRIGALVTALSQLQATRYSQYDGPFPAATGLRWPRLIVEVTLAPTGPNFVLRIGGTTDSGQVFAAAGSADHGPAFYLPAPSWNDFIRSGESFPPIPDDPFALLPDPR
jgi:hypothetical protein